MSNEYKEAIESSLVLFESVLNYYWNPEKEHTEASDQVKLITMTRASIKLDTLKELVSL
jgi:hypothetical protein